MHGQLSTEYLTAWADMLATFIKASVHIYLASYFRAAATFPASDFSQ